MIKILFICHGNICRSPMAEFTLRDMAERVGLSGELEIDSAATSAEELGNPVYPPAALELSRHGIACTGKTARRMRSDDYQKYDLLIGMDAENRREMLRLFGGDSEAKLHLLLEYAGRPGEAVADPWYTRDFEQTWRDVEAGCRGLIESLLPAPIKLDLTACRSREQLYAVLREALDWQSWYGSNLDALHDVLTGLPHRGSRFSLILPPEDTELFPYALRVQRVFAEAGALYEKGMQET